MWSAAFAPLAAGEAAAAKRDYESAAMQRQRRNAKFNPDSDDEAVGPSRPKASLTWLQNVVCGISGQRVPREGGDDTLIMAGLDVRVSPGCSVAAVQTRSSTASTSLQSPSQPQTRCSWPHA